MDGLRRCPHCGGTSCLTAHYSYKTRSYFVFVRCDICGAQGKIYHSDDDPDADGWNNAACNDAVNAWNMRTSDRRNDADE